VVPEAVQPVFYYDLGSPGCYLLAERIMSELPVVPEWEPILAVQLGINEPRPDADSLGLTVAEQGLQPLRLPDRWPPDTELAMLTGAYAKRGGRAVAYSLAAFRQAFAGGRDLGDEGTVLIAAAACEMHPTAVLKGVTLRSTKRALHAAGERAQAAGVTELPAIQIGDRLFSGDTALPEAIAVLGNAVAAAGPDENGAPEPDANGALISVIPSSGS
jgi:2-hydroxychromene-2-carboxylate isomerase